MEVEHAGGDLVVVALSGVQRFIRESRSTSDLSSASRIVARLSAVAARNCVVSGAELVFPAASAVAEETGVPNRIVALTPSGQGRRTAEDAAAAVARTWEGWVRTVMGRQVATPGMPSVQWVCVPASVGDYAEQWRVSQEALVARRRVRDFPTVEEPQRQLCSLSPRWPAETASPEGLRPHEQDRLCATNWVKRLWRQRLSQTGGASPSGAAAPGFASTSAVASAPFRRQVLECLDDGAVADAVGKLKSAVELLGMRARETPVQALDLGLQKREPDRWFASSAGRWVYPDTWQSEGMAREFPDIDPAVRERAVRQGSLALRSLEKRMSEEYGVASPAGYLAVLAQDLDSMGRFLGGESWGPRPGVEVSSTSHHSVSERLSSLAAALRSGVEDEARTGVTVYAGGDDLLAFTPASTAMATARYCHDAVPDDLPRASTAVLFFHHRSSLQRAVTQVQELLELAKDEREGKHGLAVGFVRHSGAREESLQPWARTGAEHDDPGPARDFALFTRGVGVAGLSPRLVAVLAKDAEELSDPGLPQELYEAEVSRLVARHGGAADEARAVLSLGRWERSVEPSDARRNPVPAVRVAAFLRQECG